MSALSVCLLASLAHAADRAGIIISIQGQVDVTQDGRRARARLRQDLFVGNAVHTGPASRAAILLVDETQLKVNANSTLELRAIGPRPGEPVPVAVVSPVRTILQILQGETWVRNRGKAGFFEIQTPAVTASIRGTEFNLAVAPDGESRIVVLEGLINYQNPFGAVQVGPGEGAVARVGQPPSKVVVLRPQDAVQWSLYYPGIVSFRDYPFVSPDPQELERQLQQLGGGGPADPPERHLRRGEILHDLGRRDEARGAFEAALRQDPGNARALTGLGWLLLEANRPAEALGEFRQAYPRLPMTIAGQAFALYRTDRLLDAAEVAEDGVALFPGSPLLVSQAAFFHLLQGRVDAARRELEEALALDPRYWPAHGLLANVFLVQNQKAAAAEAAQRAVQANPHSPGALLNLSLVRQAEFQLDEALRLASQAAALDPTNAQPRMFEARLLFGMGRLREAFRVIDRAAMLVRDDPFVLTTRGFLLLAQRDDYAAQTHFEWALDRDSTQGLPYVGLGLIHFQRREVEAGVQAMLAATLLDPRISLYQSYYGKALWESGRREEALQALQVAKELDPKDPTPHLYAGIFQTDLNNPGPAIRELYEAIARNDNRAVYRSRFLLDRDLATTNVSLSRVFDRFGQAERARSLAVNSLETDPGNHSAHLFFGSALLAEGLGSTTAAGSEIFQAFLLEPVNQNAVASFNDYTSLFERPRVEGTLTGRLESPRLQEYDAILRAGNSYAAIRTGVTYFRNTGVHKLNDDERFRQTVTLLKVAPTIDTELGATISLSDDKAGDLRRDQNYFALNDTDRRGTNVFFDISGGIHHRLGPGADLLVAVRGSRFRRDVQNVTIIEGAVPTFFPIFPFQFVNPDSFRIKESFIDTQAALTYRIRNHDLVFAFDHFKGTQTLEVNSTFTTTIDFLGFLGLGVIPFPNTVPGVFLPVDAPPIITRTIVPREFVSVLAQDTWAILPGLRLTGGVQFDYLADGTPFLVTGPDTLYGSHWSPRVGLTYQLNGKHTFRGAAIWSVETHTAPRLSPTQVAGFLIEHPGLSSARIRQYHLGWDGHLSPRTFLRLQLFSKTIDVPEVVFLNGGRVVQTHRFSRTGIKAELNQTLTDSLSFSAGYLRFRRSDAASPSVGTQATEGDEDQARVAANFLHPTGLFARAEALYTRQDLGPYRTPGSPPYFWTTNLLLGYEFPRKWGLIEVGALNVFRERFQLRPDAVFLSESLITRIRDPRTFTTRDIVPDRSYFVRLVVNL